MSIENYVTMGCNCCGKVCKIDTQTFWQTDGCVRGEAEDEGWSCENGGGNDQDFCPECMAVKLTTILTMFAPERCIDCRGVLHEDEIKYLGDHCEFCERIKYG